MGNEDLTDQEGNGGMEAGLPLQRERAVVMLSESFAKNYLELEEFERRIDLAQKARSLKELAGLISDLPAEFDPNQAVDLSIETGSVRDRRTAGSRAVNGRAKRRSSAGHLSRRSAQVPAFTKSEKRILSIMSSRHFRGQWLDSRAVVIRSLMSSVDLDFRDIALPAGVYTIEIGTVMGSVTITVPPELAVELEVIPIMGETKEKGGVRHNAAAGNAVLRVTGFIVMGEVIVRVR